MISHISIKDFAIINQLSVDFHPGLNIITGETGAGKSIIIEAISLVLGSRADTTYISSGKDKALVQIVFEDVTNEICLYLNENGIDIQIDSQIIITREITTGGKSLCKINGQIISVSVLNKICKRLADIHGQYDHQSLLIPENHINFVDLYGLEQIGALKEKVFSSYKNYLFQKQKLSSIVKNESDSLRHRDFMEFERNEIFVAKLQIGEDEELLKEITLLQNGEKIFENLQMSYDSLYESTPSSLSEIKKVIDMLSNIEEFSPEIKQNKEILSDSYYRIQEVSSEIRKLKEGISFNQEDLDNSISRLDYIEILKRKYGGTIEKVIEYMESLDKKLEIINNFDALKLTVEKELKFAEEELISLCSLLSESRKKVSIKLEQEINNQLLELNFKDAKIFIEFSKKTPEGNGTDIVEFIISTNKGEAPKPLAKIASGGEISRIMLAFKNILGNLDSIPTMIFDEIDSGISGITASIVGRKLLQISSKHQIICITHLPQIAAYGDYNYKIDKVTDDNSTKTTVIPLDDQSKIMEIARLTGGLSITDSTINNARELIQFSK
ncbi:MAG: DNA repair protein RecN [Peptostreptococcaceae bacterium]|nr:DNA repair protein RecN [Peptostreptococcaceae bacterium]